METLAGKTNILEEQFKYNEVYPSLSAVYWSYQHIYDIWPELKPYDSTIYVIVAQLNYPEFHLRKPENVVEEIREAYTNGKRNIYRSGYFSNQID